MEKNYDELILQKEGFKKNASLELSNDDSAFKDRPISPEIMDSIIAMSAAILSSKNYDEYLNKVEDLG